MKPSHFALVVLTVGLLCVGNAGCKDGNKDKSDASVLFDNTLAKAKGGNATAMVEVGDMYRAGKGVIEDDFEALKWYRKAAELGDTDVMFRLGHMYANGQGVIEDDFEALKWYRKAAELGDTDVMLSIGYMYAEGHGVIQDHKEALKWYRKAAELGDTSAMFRLGFIYDHGRVAITHGPHARPTFAKRILDRIPVSSVSDSVIEDVVEGYAWFNVAAANGDYEMAAMARERIKKRMTTEQIFEGQKRSREIMKTITEE